MFVVLVSVATANTPITSFSAIPSTTQAGGHPDLSVSLGVDNRILQGSHSPCNCEDARDATIHLPTGFIGDPHSTPRCSIADFSADSCPIDSQIGIAAVEATGLGFPFLSAVYNLVPPPDVAGLSGFKIFLFDTPQFTVLSGRTGSDYGLDATARSIYHQIPLGTLQEEFWGVPADPSHDALRLDPSALPFGPAYVATLCDAEGNPSTNDPRTIAEACPFPTNPHGNPSNSPLTPFLQNPTTCDSPLSPSLDVLSYDGGVTHADGTWPQMTGCDQLAFNPSLFARPTTTHTDSASGIDVNLQVPQPQSPSVPSPSELRAATVTLPEGLTINPNAADGKSSCTNAEARFGTEEEALCPQFSKIGSLTIEDTALPGPLPGFIYLGEPLPGNRFRLFLAADAFAVHLKLQGTVKPNPATGQLTIVFENLPQQPVSGVDMHFFGSERGLLATPTKCGTYAVKSTFTPWDSSLSSQTSSQFFNLDTGPGGSPCPGSTRPFDPSFDASSIRDTAGAYTPFSVNLSREDGQQDFAGLEVTAPPGLSARLAGIPYCPESAIARVSDSLYPGLSELATSACPHASQVGTAIAGVGAGTHPLYVPGKVYLAGPYGGGPLSLEVVIPAVSGPYDLGNVAVRAAIKVNPVSGQVTAVSDPLPQILEGIPLRARSIHVSLDRPEFALNPTDCDPLSVNASALGDEGATVSLSHSFQVASCVNLGFAPKIGFELTGSAKRTGHPSLTATLTTRKGEANIAGTVVTLPHSEFLDNSHIQTPCTRPQFATDACPPQSVVGFATAESPLLSQALRGPVYLRASVNKLPDLVADLRGQIHIELDGRIDTVHQRLRTSFESIPDLPVSKFRLSLLGGKKGLLVNSENLCTTPHDVAVVFSGQNARHISVDPELQAHCHAKTGKTRVIPSVAKRNR